MMISFCRISSRGPPSQVPFLAGGAAHFFSKNLLLPGHVHKASLFIPLEKPWGFLILNNIIEGTKMISSHFWGPMEKENHLPILCKNFCCSSARGNNLQGTNISPLQDLFSDPFESMILRTSRLVGPMDS